MSAGIGCRCFLVRSVTATVSAWHRCAMLFGRGAVRCRAGAHAAGAAACAGPGRAVAGGVRWGGRGVCASGVGVRPCRYCVFYHTII